MHVLYVHEKCVTCDIYNQPPRRFNACQDIWLWICIMLTHNTKRHIITLCIYQHSYLNETESVALTGKSQLIHLYHLTSPHCHPLCYLHSATRFPYTRYSKCKPNRRVASHTSKSASTTINRLRPAFRLICVANGNFLHQRWRYERMAVAAH